MTRAILPQRRCHETFDLQHGKFALTVGIGRAHPAGPIQEVFLNSGKSGTDVETLSRDSAVLISLGLQHGVSLDTMAKAITRNVDGTPSGPIGALLDMMAGEA